MIFSSSLIENAVVEFSKLPGIGKKTAMRLVLHLLKQEESIVQKFSDVISKMRHDIKYCTQCHNVSDDALCNICSDFSRKKSIICVVESVRDVMAIEATQQYSGLYHVLGGLISPLDGIGPEAINIYSLVNRLEKNSIDELLLAISPTNEGDTTAYYITKKVKHLKLKITTLSRGVAFGGELEYADELTLARSIVSRMPIENIVSGHA